MPAHTTAQARRLMAISDRSSLSYGHYLNIVVFSKLDLIVIKGFIKNFLECVAE